MSERRQPSEAIICITLRDFVALAKGRTVAQCGFAGTEVRDCQQCGAEIMVAPRSLEMLKERPSAMLMCERCAAVNYNEHEREGDSVAFGLMPGQPIEWIKSAMKRMRIGPRQ